MLIKIALEDRVEQVDVPEHEILEFPEGLIGFEDCTRFALFNLDVPFLLLQSIADPYLGFVLINPLLIDPEYRVAVGDSVHRALRLQDGESPSFLAIVCLSTDGSPATANLRAPIAINPSSRIGMQLVLQDSDYAIKYLLSDFLASLETDGRGSSSSAEVA